MWMLILGALLLGTLLGIVYLGNRFSGFYMAGRQEKGRRFFRFLTGLLPVLLIFAVTGVVFGPINGEICILHMVVIWLLCDGVSYLVEKKRGKTFMRYYAGMCALAITALYLSWGWYQANHVWRKEYEIATEKQVGRLRVVQFADSHVGNILYGEKFTEQIKAIQSEKPDIVVITGDYIDDDTSKEDMIAACEALGTLKTTYGVYYVFGNHDRGYYGPEYRGYSGEDLVAELEKNNVTVLEDEVVVLDSRFYLIGRQDRSGDGQGGGRASMEELTEGLDSEKYSIVLDHQPHDYENQAAAGVDLVLSGHTHGGQLFPFNHMGEWTGIDDKTYGLERRKQTDFIVTSGISDWAVKFRTGCRAEYVVIDIQEN